MDRADDRVRALRFGAALVPLAFLGVFFFWPLSTVLARGLSPGSIEVLGSARTGSVIWFTTWQAALSTVLTLALALPGAWALSHRPFRGASALRALLTVAFVLPTVVVAAAFHALGRAGLAPWGTNGVAAILAAHVFFNYAVVVRVVGAAWSQIHPESEEAARLLGAGPLAVFWRVDLPRLRGALAAACSIVFLFTFTSFGVVLILGDLRHSTIEVEIWRRTLQLLDLSGAAGLALVQMTAVGISLLVWSRLQRGGRSVGAWASRPREGRTPRRWAQILALLPGILLIGAPVLSLIWRSFAVPGGVGLDWYRALGTSRRGTTLFVAPWEAVGNSLLFAAAAGGMALVIGGLGALVVARRRRPVLAGSFDAALMLPLGTSAVTLGFGLLITFDRAPLDLRASVVIVPIAHALVGIPFVIRALVPALRSVPRELAEAASTLGARRVNVLRRVELPLVSRPLVVAVGFAIAVSLGEFGATSFLARPSRPTVPVAIYRFLGQPGAANQGQALALSALLMALVAGVVLLSELAGEGPRPLRRARRSP